MTDSRANCYTTNTIIKTINTGWEPGHVIDHRTSKCMIDVFPHGPEVGVILPQEQETKEKIS